ncbi:hypothetical protein E2C01_096426 [Portunus trituberculatus]|uniref:Uncharacterized protein n=1 Tax=Portunus trituberculatus TaxID=210409 RepID=A0A5B7K1Q2_PORTR|nr:hypothetical protein [Portunus trituberculatus]
MVPLYHGGPLNLFSTISRFHVHSAYCSQRVASGCMSSGSGSVLLSPRCFSSNGACECPRVHRN